MHSKIHNFTGINVTQNKFVCSSLKENFPIAPPKPKWPHELYRGSKSKSGTLGPTTHFFHHPHVNRFYDSTAR
ncbi:hypothetical protein LguiA_012369 [Lonicera macranthoides]